MNEMEVHYNITNLSLAQLQVNGNRFKLSFDETLDAADISQDAIDIEIDFEYSLVTVPPIVADQGAIRVSLSDLTITSQVTVVPNP